MEHDSRILLVTPEFTCGTLPSRNAETTEQCYAQFNVETNPLLQPSRDAQGRLQTWCNWYVALCTAAAGAPLPYFRPICWHTPESAWLFDEQGANEMCEWLHITGPKYGWKPVAADMAREHANAGRPVVATWHNPSTKGSGHVAMVLSSGADGPLMVAQAGLSCLWRKPIVQGFGADKLLAIEYFSHP